MAVANVPGTMEKAVSYNMFTYNFSQLFTSWVTKNFSWCNAWGGKEKQAQLEDIFFLVFPLYKTFDLFGFGKNTKDTSLYLFNYCLRTILDLLAIVVVPSQVPYFQLIFF